METKEERIERRRREKAEQVAYKLEREIATWDPNNIEALTEDPFKTLFVARIVSFILNSFEVGVFIVFSILELRHLRVQVATRIRDLRADQEDYPQPRRGHWKASRIRFY